MDLLVVISNCPHPLRPGSFSEWPSIEVIRHRGRTYTPADPCRNAGPETQRAFEFTDRLAQ